ncbi:hypothetical protein ACET3Z_013830 [Daucus carota]
MLNYFCTERKYLLRQYSLLMASLSCLCSPPLFLKNDESRLAKKSLLAYTGKDQITTYSIKSVETDPFSRHPHSIKRKSRTEWSFKGGSRVITGPNIQRFARYRKSCGVFALWLTNPQIASSAFTLGTAAVLPYYTLMVVAPKSKLTKKSIESGIPYVALGLLYGYLLYLSWTPDTMKLMFASEYWLPELSGIAKMFSSEMTLASAWIHLLAVDLFAARQVYHDGLENKIETRHSISLCLLFCPIGIISHVVTKALTKSTE